MFDKATVFADNMMFPEGAMWLDGSLYVAAPPSIWKLTDTDGDGVADRREEWFEGKTLTGCANDLHGPYLGPDGWIYWCKGAFAEQTYERQGRPPLVDQGRAHLPRRPDRRGLEPVMTGGMDNPVEVDVHARRRADLHDDVLPASRQAGSAMASSTRSTAASTARTTTSSTAIRGPAS